ncbi:MAG: NUDIX domain-containing protein [Jatrophihabitans sp.]|uniref:NUDIX domain-containing protein n=1 Tax=Jatrophihabitans sp. TaxID=1932789 RepID=UPI003F7D7B3D
MLIAPNADLQAHAVSVHPATTESPFGYHRLIGGSVELGETGRDAMVREVAEELSASIDGLTLLGVVENIFRVGGVLDHEVVFVYTGRLRPEPALVGASLMESDGSSVPIVWRPFDDDGERVPLYPAGAIPWVRHVQRAVRTT